MLYDLADGLRAVAVALSPYLPETAPRILEALGQPRDARLGAGRVRPARAAPTGSSRRRRSSRGSTADRRGVIDTHAHLDACARPAGRLVARAGSRRRRGSSRSGPGSTPAARRSRSPTRHDRRLRGARDPSAPGRRARRDAARRAARAARPTSAPSPWARPGSTSTATTRRTTASASSSSASSSWPPSSASRSSSTRAPPTTRPPQLLDGFDRHRGPALLLGAGAPAGRARARLLRLVRRQRHLPEGRGAARGCARRPGRSPARRDGQPVPRAAAACAASRTSPRTSCTPSPRSPRRAARIADELGAQIDANATRRLRPRVSRPGREEGSSASTSWSTRTSSA